jgi:hypothetical protein
MADGLPLVCRRIFSFPEGAGRAGHMIISFMIAYSHRAYVQRIPTRDDANREPPKEASKYPADASQKE